MADHVPIRYRIFFESSATLRILTPTTMGRELQKKKRKSSLPKKRQKPPSKKKILANPIIAANW